MPRSDECARCGIEECRAGKEGLTPPLCSRCASEMHQRGVPDTEFSEGFVTGMRDRMAVSFHKYGAVADAYPHRVNAIESAEARIAKFKATGNGEWLVDAANFLMIETMRPRHPGYHFRGTDSDESIGRVTHDPDMIGRGTRNKDLLTEEQVAEFNGDDGQPV